MKRARAGGIRVAAVAALSLAFVTVGSSAAHADLVRDYQYWLSDYGFTTAWNTSRGDGVKVAVIDTGVDGTVAEMQGAIVGGTDVSGIGSPNGQTPVGTDDSHGTMVAGLLAGRGSGPGNGVIGVAPDADLLTISVAFGANTGATSDNDTQIAEAVRWAVDNGADVINMSLTRNTADWPESWDDAFMYAFENDVVIVAAAGNRGAGTTAVGAPATIPGVLTVAGVNRDKEASFDASSQGITIGVAAPSEDLVGVIPGGSYVKWNGTSGAAPLVSGLVALVRAAYPDLDAGNVINRITATADLNGHEAGGPIYGYGLINPPGALTADVPLVDKNPAAELAEWIRVHRRADVPPDQSGETPVPQEIVPIKDPPLPRAANEASLFPTTWTLTYITLPLVVVTGFGTLAALLGIGATRQLKRAARN